MTSATSLSILCATESATKEAATTTSAGLATAAATHMVQIATQVRALRLQGKQVILFAPVGKSARARGVVQEVAGILSLLDHAAVLILGMHPDATDDSLRARDLPEWDVGAHMRQQKKPLALHTREDTGQVLHLDATAGHAEQMPSLIAGARTDMRYVLLDAPSVLEAAATSLVVPNVDAVVLLVHRGSTSQGDLEATKHQFRSLGALLAGFVFLD